MTKEDLKQIREIIREELNTEITPLKSEMKSMKTDFEEMKNQIKTLVIESEQARVRDESMLQEIRNTSDELDSLRGVVLTSSELIKSMHEKYGKRISENRELINEILRLVKNMHGVQLVHD